MLPAEAQECLSPLPTFASVSEGNAPCPGAWLTVTQRPSHPRWRQFPLNPDSLGHVVQRSILGYLMAFCAATSAQSRSHQSRKFPTPLHVQINSIPFQFVYYSARNFLFLIFPASNQHCVPCRNCWPAEQGRKEMPASISASLV